MHRLRVILGVGVGAAIGLAVFLATSPATGQPAPDPVMAGVCMAAGAFFAFLVAAGSWVATRTAVPYRDPLPPPGWRGRTEP